VTDDPELKEQREAVLKAIYELRLLRPTMIGLLENYERWIKQRVAREAAELCEQAGAQREAMFRASHGETKELNRHKAQQSFYLAFNIRAHFGLDPTTEEQPK
jgi:hypothetical protein